MKAWFAILLMTIAAPTTSAAPACKKIDLMTGFWHVLDSTGSVADFRKEVTSGHPEIYNDRYVHAFADAKLSSTEVKDLAWAREHRQEVNAATLELQDHVSDYLNRFGLAFSDFRCDFSFYIAPSFGHMDGAAATLDGKPMIVFAPDVIPQYHAPGTLKLFMNHETFHIYHWQVSGGEFGANESPSKTYVTLWSEGLAVYVSWQMNPDRNVDEALLQNGIRNVSESRLRALAREMLVHFDEVDNDLYENYFTGGAHPDDAPPRVGYYLGFLVARDLALQYSTKELAAMRGELARSKIRETLQHIADSTTPLPARVGTAVRR